MRESIEGPSTSYLPPNEQPASHDDLLEEVEAFEGKKEEVDVIEEIDHYQSDEGNLPSESNPHRHQSSTDEGLPLVAPILYVAIRCHKF